MLDIFVSYSRKNLDFVQHLSDDLEQVGKDIWFDKKKEALQGIPAGSLWWDEIKRGIESADNFLMIITPQSMQSPYCHAEIAHALNHNKRIVTLLYCGEQSQTEILEAINSAIDAIDPDFLLPNSVSADISNVRSLARRNWLKLSQIQFVPYVDVQYWEQWLKQVVDAVDLDIQWVRTWSQFRQAVQIWAENDYSDEYRWPEPRLKPIRDEIAQREQGLNEDETNFFLHEQERLLRVLEDINTTEQRRMTIGTRLADIGDTRKGVGVIDGLPDIAWLPVAQGGYIRMEGSIFKVEPFYIAKYLVTYTQYQAFVDAQDGFNNLEWWKDFPDEYYHQKIKEQRIKSPNNPRDSLSWYQSVAFSRWLDAKYRELGLFNNLLVGTLNGVSANPNDWQIRLPLEWEWQWAAQNGMEYRKHPWGDWQKGFADMKDSGLDRAITVGMYPHGAAECGALDMSGNLHEWCANDYSNPEKIDIANELRKVLRGGSFESNQSQILCASRYYSSPYYAYNRHGFRLVLAPSIAL